MRPGDAGFVASMLLVLSDVDDIPRRRDPFLPPGTPNPAGLPWQPKYPRRNGRNADTPPPKVKDQKKAARQRAGKRRNR